MSEQLGINPEMDRLASDYGLGHWSCVSPKSHKMWVRSDGMEWYFDFIGQFDNQLLINVLDDIDFDNPIGKDWQQQETEEEFLSRKLPCDIKIGSGVNKAGTSIRTLLLRVNSIIGSKDLVVDKEKQARAKKMLLNLIEEGDTNNA